MRRLPRGVNLKCFTAFVTYTWPRSTPASSSARCSRRPAGPTNGMPSRSSTSPGCSPTRATGAPGFPAEKTTWVAGSHSSQPRQSGAVTAQQELKHAGDLQRQALVVVADMADLNGWQNAYAFQVATDGPSAAE